MAEIGVIASVLQVAQCGAQLSISLYNVAQTVKSANQDVKRIAKEIALFAQVLKDLGSALERGRGSQIYRGDAYKTSRMIVEECEAVFREIEEILFKKTTKGTSSFETGISIPKTERFLWVFRKGRVQLLRSNLESLKSTISLKLAVLSYADNHACLKKPLDDLDEVLSLKSLVLANETATSELQEVTSRTIKEPEEPGTQHAWKPGPIATHGVWNISPTNEQVGSSFIGSVLTPIERLERTGSLGTPYASIIPRSRDYKGDPEISVLSHSNFSISAVGSGLPDSGPHEVYGRSSTENAAGLQDFSAHRRCIWGDLDKLELALKKLDVAIWELDRIEKNMKFGWPLEHLEQQSSLIIRLKEGLGRFGLSTEQIRWGMNRLAKPNLYLGQRTKTTQVIPKFDVDLTTLQDHGITFTVDKNNHDLLSVKRWLPDYFEDILSSHIRQRLHTMQVVSKPEPVYHQPRLRVGKTRSRRTRTCAYPESGKDSTQAEHHRYLSLPRHELKHSSEPYQCGVAESHNFFHHRDILVRHMERQHNDTESHRDYRHGRSMSQVSMAELDSAHTVTATTVPPLSPSMLESATQPSSTMSIYSIVDHNTPPGFITQPMGTLNDLSQPAVPAEPHGFSPELVYGRTSDESPFYSSNSCHSSNPEYSHAQIAGQSYLPRDDNQHSPSFTPYMGPCYQPPLYSTLTLPAWCETETSRPPQELPGTDHFEGSFLQPVGTPAPPRDDSQHLPSHTRYIYKQPLYLPSVVPAWCETETSPNEGSGTSPSSASSKPGPDTAWNTPVTSIEATTSASAEPQRRHTTSRSTRQSHHMDHGTPNQQSPPTPSLQSMSTYYDPPRKRRRESSSTTAVYSASSGNLDELQLHFDAPLIHGVNNIADKKAETNEKAEAAGTADEAQESDPAQAVNHLLRKWTTLFDMPSAPSWDSGWQSAVS